MSVGISKRLLAAIFVAAGLGMVGCGSNANSTFSFVGSRLPPGSPELQPPTLTVKADSVAVAGRAAADAPQPGADAIERKIIYSGQLTVVVKDLDAAVTQTEQLLDEFKAYIAKSEIIGNAGTRRQATFTIRVPAESFRKFKTALIALGIAERNTSDSKDVTEEYVDISSRVRNLKAEEETLNKLLKETAHRLEEILRLREEIKRLRGEIEVAEGRLKYLSALASLSTLELTLKELQGTYKPPEPESPMDATFSERISSTFTGSVRSLRRFGEAIAVFLVGIGPWLPVLLIGGFVVYRVLRRISRMSVGTVQRREPPRRVQAEPVEPPQDTTTES